MKYMPLIAVLLAGNVADAQDTIQPYRYSAKAYLNINRMAANTGFSTRTDVRVTPAFAFQARNKDGNAHEFELTDFAFNAVNQKSDDPATGPFKNRSTYVVLRYEYILNLMKKRNAKLAPAIGFAALPHYASGRQIPLTSVSAPTRSVFFGVKGAIVPRVTYNITNRLYADLNIPITVLAMSHDRFTTKDPAIRPEQRTRTLTSFDMLPKQGVDVRIGLGIRF